MRNFDKKATLIADKKPCPSCFISHTPDKCPTLARGKVAAKAASSNSFGQGISFPIALLPPAPTPRGRFFTYDEVDERSDLAWKAGRAAGSQLVDVGEVSSKERQRILHEMLKEIPGPIDFDPEKRVGFMPLCMDEVRPGQTVAFAKPCFRHFVPERLVILEPTVEEIAGRFEPKTIPRSAWSLRHIFVGCQAVLENQASISGDAFHPGNDLSFEGVKCRSGIPITFGLAHNLSFGIPFSAVLFGTYPKEPT